MNAHRSMQRSDIAQREPGVIALMIASEFSRAASRSAHRDNVLNCYARAQELFGIMETLPLSEEAASLFQPLYRECASNRLVAEPRLVPEIVEELGTRLAEAFQSAAEKLSQGHSHA
jgi:hypothetical protein